MPGGLLRDAALYGKLAAAGLRSRFLGLPYLLNLHLTWRCNSRCRHCGIWEVEDHSGEFRLEEYEKLFYSSAESVAILNLTGGQPTLKPGFAAVVGAARRILKRLVLVHVTTNALTPDADLRFAESFLREPGVAVLRLSISLDGLGGGHDAVRGSEGNFGKVAALFKRLTPLRAAGSRLRVGFSTTIGEHNRRVLRELRAAFPGKDHHTFDFEQEAPSFYRIPPGERRPLAEAERRKCVEELLGGRGTGYLEGLINLLFLRLSCAGKAVPACEAGRGAISVFPDGDVRRCYFKTGSLGALRDADCDLKTLLSGARDRLSEDCRDCWNTCNAYATLAGKPLESLSSLLAEGRRSLKK